MSRKIPDMRQATEARRRRTGVVRRRAAEGANEIAGPLSASGLFITFEGGEGSGKSTQIRLLAHWLQGQFAQAGFRQGQGYPVLVTREPGGTPVADQIRQLLLDQKTKISPHLELFLYEVARRDHVKEVILPALQRGMIVLCDRFTDSTLAYQGNGRGHPVALLQAMNSLATGSLKPTLTFLLDLPVEVGLARSKKRLKKQASREGRFEALSRAFHERVRTGYLTLAAKERKRFCVIDATGNKKQVAELIRQAWRKAHVMEENPRAGTSRRVSARGR